MGGVKLRASQAHLRAGDADRDRVADELTRHCAAGRLTTDELSQRLDVVYDARTLGELATVLRDLPRLAASGQPPHRRGWRLAAAGGAGLTGVVLVALAAGVAELLAHDPVAAALAVVVLVACALLVVAALGSLLATLAPLVALGLTVRWVVRRVAAGLETGSSRPQVRA